MWDLPGFILGIYALWNRVTNTCFPRHRFALWIAQDIIVIMNGRTQVVSIPGFIPARFDLIVLFRQSDNLKRNDQSFLEHSNAISNNPLSDLGMPPLLYSLLNSAGGFQYDNWSTRLPTEQARALYWISHFKGSCEELASHELHADESE